MNRGITFAIIIILGVVCVSLLSKVCASKQKMHKGLKCLLVVYMLGNLYYTLLSRITISAAELEAKLATVFVEVFSNQVSGSATSTSATSLQTGAAVEEVIENAARPMLDPTSSYYAMNTFVLNVLLYIPLGYLLPSLFPKLCGKTKFVILIGFLLSFATETTQLVFNLGQFDVRDLVCNTVGAAIGLAVYHLFLKRGIDSKNV